MAVTKGSFGLPGERSIVIVDPKTAKKQVAKTVYYSAYEERKLFERIKPEELAAALDAAADTVANVKAGVIALNANISSKTRRIEATCAIREQLARLQSALDLIQWTPQIKTTYADVTQDVRFCLPRGRANAKF